MKTSISFLNPACQNLLYTLISLKILEYLPAADMVLQPSSVNDPRRHFGRQDESLPEYSNVNFYN